MTHTPIVYQQKHGRNKINNIILIITVLLFCPGLFGCAAQQESVSTTTSTVTTTIATTTTLSGYSISGTVSWTWEAGNFGTLWIIAATPESIGESSVKAYLMQFNRFGPYFLKYLNSTEAGGLISLPFTIMGLNSGTYVLQGWLYMDRWLAQPEDLKPGDKYQASASPITIESINRSNISFEFN